MDGVAQRQPSSDARLNHGDRDNHFNLLRILLAAGVLLGHCFALTAGHRNFDGEPWFTYTGGARLLGITCVLGFFVISGYLVSQSFERSPSLFAYFRARVLRIYPAAIVCALLSALVLGPLVSSLPLADYLRAGDLRSFLLQTTTFLNLNSVGRSLPGVFAGNPIPGNMNGSLWTISWELLCYVVLVPFGALLYRARAGVGRGIGYGLLLLLAIAGSIQYALRPLPNTLVAGFVTFWGFFSIGILGRAILPKLPNRPLLTVAALLLFLAIERFERHAPALAVIVPVLFGYVLLSAATQLPRVLLRYNRLGDFSYGLYLYAWPAQQTVVFLWPEIGPWTLLPCALALALVAAVVSWRVIEQPALRLKRRTPSPSAAPAPLAEPA